MDIVSKEDASEFIHELATATELRHLLGLRGIAFSDAVLTDKLFFLNVDGECLYPKFFADHAFSLAHIEAVCQDLHPLPSLSKFNFFRDVHPSLSGKTPLTALSENLLAEARHAAAASRSALSNT
jgi:hypothetical protein